MSATIDILSNKGEEASWTERTQGLCPVCLRTVDACLTAEEGRIWLTATCTRHGRHRALLASDAEEYLRLRTYVPPRVSAGGCCGGEEEEVCCTEGPPVCVLLLEITLACNLRCPTCYADAHGHDYLPPEEIRPRLDAFFRRQSRLDVLMLSGGEPTVHPQFAEILRLALEYPIGRVLINTNGLMLNRSDTLLALIAGHKNRVELFFSFSSFRPEVHERLYGKDLRVEKQGALTRAQDAGIFVTLVPTIERGVNEDEIGDLYRYALSLDNVNGLNFQPVMSAGRFQHDYVPEQRLTLTDVLHALEEQTGGALRSGDFIGLPCSHPDCCALTYGFLDAKRETIAPLPRHFDVSRYLDLISDRISFAGMLGGVARRVWSDVAHLRGRQTLRDLATLFYRGGLREVIPLIGKPDAFGRRIFRIVIKPFMDANTYDHKRIAQCCTKILTSEGDAISFCEYNVLHRGRKHPEAIIPLTLRSAPGGTVGG